ncbi:hypothetical protein DXC89_04475 [Prevotella disiens]|uniref:Uncharacterized protein n=2 Tax=Prevotella disiens TaxID=28130 RepID=A0A3E4QLB2_9BACT|nr:hypothetical protein DXC89_04475 [Prevotella disiens]
MQNMKKIILSLLAMGLFVASPLTATSNNSNGMVVSTPKKEAKITPKALTQKLAKELKLNKQQKAKILKLNTEYAEVIACPHGNGIIKPMCKHEMEGCKGSCDKQQGECKKQCGNDCKKEGGSNCTKNQEGCKGKCGNSCKCSCDKQQGECKKQCGNDCKKEGGCKKECGDKCKMNQEGCKKECGNSCKNEQNGCDKSCEKNCNEQKEGCKKNSCEDSPRTYREKMIPNKLVYYSNSKPVDAKDKHIMDMRAKRNSYISRLQTILTKEQFAKYLKL